jgi:hypothetical protein
MKDNDGKINEARRRFVRKAVYVAPAVLTLSSMPFTASYGSQPVSDGGLLDESVGRGRRFRKINKRRRTPKKTGWHRDDQ